MIFLSSSILAATFGIACTGFSIVLMTIFGVSYSPMHLLCTALGSGFGLQALILFLVSTEGND